MKEAILELAHREYTMGDYANAEIHCKQVNLSRDRCHILSRPVTRTIAFSLTLILEDSELPISSRSEFPVLNYRVRFRHRVIYCRDFSPTDF